MKTLFKNFYVKFPTLLILSMSYVVALHARPTVSVTPVHGTCVSDCQLTVNVSDTIGPVTYVLKNYPTVGLETPPQTSNIFSGLLPGTYTVGVYDATTAGVSENATTSVTTSYVSLSANLPVVGYSSSEYCNDNGTMSLTFSGGKSPFRVRITNTTTGIYSEQNISVSSSPRTVNFSGLASGNYIFEIQDDCGQWQQNAPGSFVTVNGAVNNLSSTPITSLNVTRTYTTSTYIQGVSGDCSRLTFRIYYPDMVVYAGATRLNLDVYQQLKFRLEYPAGSGNYNSEGWINGYATAVFNVSNYDPAQTNGTKYRVQVEHPCSGAVTVSADLTINETFTAKTSNTFIDYCTESPVITVGYPTTSEGTDAVRTYGCGPYTVTLKQGSTVISTKTIPATGTTTAVSFTASDGVQTGVTYSVDIVSTGTRPYSQTISGVTVSSSLPNLNSINFNVYDGVSGGGAPISPPWTRGFNFIYCDFTTTGFCISIPTTAPGTITVSIAAVSPTPAITRTPVTVTNPSGYFRLWTDIPWGTYDVTVDYGCTTRTYPLTLTQPVSGFTVDTVTATDDPVLCGRFALTGEAYWHMNGVKKVPGNEAYCYWMLIVDGPAKVGTRATNYGTGGSYNTVINDLPGGTYKVMFYPYDTQISTQTINGKMVTNYPTTIYPCSAFEERTITVAEYVRPIINIPLSGGISCTNGMTNMTITVLQGSKPPFLYRYKVAGDPDSTYTPTDFQPSNVFPGLTPGNYTVQVKDQCGSITTQDVRVFNGNDQFVGIIGEVLPGVVCETREVTLSVLSIGPVQSYQWFYRQNSSSLWQTLPSDSATYVIPSADQSHKGEYKVEIYNGLCYLQSAIEIIDVLQPAATPTITGAASYCPGGSVLLTANTTVVSPFYQWYKNGAPISGANSNTYTVNSPGDYSVTVTPMQGCPSDPSLDHSVEEKTPDAPTITGNASFCAGEEAMLTAEPDIPSATYTWYLNGSSSPIYTSSSTNEYNAAQSGTYTVKVSTGGSCVSDLSDGFTLTELPALTPGTISASQTVCYNAVPAQLTGTSPGGGTLSYAYQWQSSPDGTNWTNVTDSIFASFTPPALTSDTYYRRAAASGTCDTVHSNIVTITVHPQLVPGTISADQTVCYNTAPAQLTGTPPSGGTGSYSYQWQSSPNGTNWSNVAGGTGATSDYYTPPALTSTAYYRRSETSGSCGTVYSDTVKITVNPQLTPGSISADQTVCYNAVPAQLTGTPPSGGTGSYSYQWQSSPDGTNWTNVTDSIFASFTPPALTSTMYYRRVETSDSCGTVYSDTVTVTVNSQLTPGTITGDQTVCAGVVPSQLTGASSPGGGTGSYSYQWQSSPDGTNWTNVVGGTGATADSYTPPALNSTTHYRRSETSYPCGTVYGNAVTVTVTPTAVPSITISATPN